MKGVGAAGGRSVQCLDKEMVIFLLLFKENSRS